MHDKHMHWLHKHQNALLGILGISLHLPMQHTSIIYRVFRRLSSSSAQNYVKVLGWHCYGMDQGSQIHALWGGFHPYWVVSQVILRRGGGQTVSQLNIIMFGISYILYSRVRSPLGHQAICCWWRKGSTHKLWHYTQELWHDIHIAIWPRGAGLCLVNENIMPFFCVFTVILSKPLVWKTTFFNASTL